KLGLQNVRQQVGAALAHLEITVLGPVLDGLLREQAHFEQLAGGPVADAEGAVAELAHQRRRSLLLLRRRGRRPFGTGSSCHKQDRTSYQGLNAQPETHESLLLAGTFSAERGIGSVLAPSFLCREVRPVLQEKSEKSEGWRR